MNSIGMTRPINSEPLSLRTPTQLRISSLIGYVLSLLAAIILSFSYSLLAARRILKLPASSLLSAGLIVPKTVATVAVALKTHDNPAGFEFGGGLSILRDQGRIVGVSDARGEITAWDRVPRVDSGVAVTELRGLLSDAPYIVVARGDDVRGVITQEMYLAGL
jgi:hypothetical protein